MNFTEDEIAYLRSQPLARLATVAPDGRYIFVGQAAAGTGVGRWQVARFDMQTGEADVITQAEGGAMRRPGPRSAAV